MSNEQERRPGLEYPCPWGYRVIGGKGEALRAAISEVMGEREHLVTPSSTSRGGTYRSFEVEVVVRDEAERNALYAALKGHAAVVMVL